jgi:hypothetical protein
MGHFSIKGFHGVNKTPCSIHIVPIGLAGIAYGIEDSQKVHLTWEPFLDDGVWLEEVGDYDFFETKVPIWDSEVLLLILEEIGLLRPP